jgi:hypothetical protein
MTVLWTVLGVALALPYIAAGRTKRGRPARVWWAGGLVVAALVYVGFASAAGAGWAHLGVEVGGVVIFGAFAALGLRGLPGWTAAGWLLHPIWDLAVGHPGAPEWYLWACLGFDAVVGVWLWGRALRPSGG